MNHLFLTSLISLAACVAAHAQQPGAAYVSPHPGLIPSLLDNVGEPVDSMPLAVPDRAEYRTRAGLYATELQARVYEQAVARKVISVTAECCDEQGLTNSMMSVWAQYVDLGAPVGVPVVVRGKDLKQAARLANRLTEAGFAPVFLVTMQ